MSRHSLAALCLTGFLSACAAAPEPHAGSGAAPMKEEIRDTASGGVLSRDALFDRLARARVIYLGERHDNPFHHQAQAEVVAGLIARGKRPALAFETFSRDQTGWLLNYTLGSTSAIKGHEAVKDPSERLRQLLGWTEREEWDFYRPLLELARQHGLPAFGADLPLPTRLRISRVGTGGMLAVEKLGLSQGQIDPPAYKRLISGKIARSHCLEEKADIMDRLYASWVARNEAMAEAVVAMAGENAEQPVVVILGVEHVAHDMGVVDRVARRLPGIVQINLGFREWEEGEDEGPVVVDGVTFPPEHALLWVTPSPKSERVENPCAHFKRHGKKQD